ncbi:PP2C family protein-serine/threonine phosphatase [Anthocerotibacter panamensis]|uniref:PP2C family protein-serine/threonine phosphatase n=1 Tax=Anthocerotibacter panamensis TaxID=2857077 RepID=UPI001C4077F0|nr:PP2C family serine/threonine-protein phosphatase [Anthocerotibacter panamensis]
MRTERMFPPADSTELLEEIAYPLTSHPLPMEPPRLEVGQEVMVDSYCCIVREVLPHTTFQKYLVETEGQRTYLWVGVPSMLTAQVEFLGQLHHRMLPERMAWATREETQYLLVSAAQGSTLRERLGQVGWVDLLGDYLQLVQLFKKIHQSGWAILVWRLNDVVAQRPVVLEELSHLTPLGQEPLPTAYRLGYSAPELLQAQIVTGKEDLYTLGAVFYHLLTGDEPPEGGLDLLNLPVSARIPGAIQILGRTLGPAAERCDYDELLRLVRQLRTTRQRQAYTYQVGGATTQGLSVQRTVNQDAWGYRVTSGVTEEGAIGALVACVADGVGGMAQGEVAAAVSTGIFVGAADPPPFGENAVEQGAWAVYRLLQANQGVYTQLGGSGGSTLTGVVLWGQRLSLAHIGDSRAYWLHPEGVVQLSEDHSVTRALVNSGAITAEEALTHPERNRLLRILGELRELPSSYVGTLQETLGQVSQNLGDEDVLLLCSDGAWEGLDLTEVYHLVWQNPDLQHAADTLIERVLSLGAPDNATVLLIRCIRSAVW